MRPIRKNELDVDFIGGEGPLTKEEEKAISDYISAQKAKETKTHAAPKKRATKRAKSLA